MLRVLLLCCVLGLPSLLAAAQPGKLAARRFEFAYRVEIGPIEAGRGPVHVFIPLALEDEHQQIVERTVEASIPGAEQVEPVYGNLVWHGSIERASDEPISISVHYVVERRVFHRTPPRTPGRALSAQERADLALFLQPNQRVVVGHPLLEPILAEVRRSAGSEDPVRLARATYDWVVENIEYKQVGDGWGNGDSSWASIERYGNCTDFHSLFISLARTEGIPARFQMGFPIAPDRSESAVSGYHCWVEFYLPETGWFPIDASEAFKRPADRDLFYGTHPADRIQLSSGRDLKLGPDHKAAPLNYFIYPYVEVAGEPYEGTVKKEFRYRGVPGQTARQAAARSTAAP